MDKETFLQEKKAAIAELTKQQLDLKGGSAGLSGFKIIQLEIQKHLIASQPFPKFPKGAPDSAGIAIVGEQGEEIIINRKPKP